MKKYTIAPMVKLWLKNWDALEYLVRLNAKKN